MNVDPGKLLCYNLLRILLLKPVIGMYYGHRFSKQKLDWGGCKIFLEDQVPTVVQVGRQL
jgi:hypothetical protein